MKNRHQLIPVGMTKVILSICCVIIIIGCQKSEPSLIYPRGEMVELSDSTGWNYIMKTSDPQDQICQYFKKTMTAMEWTLHNEVPSHGGNLSFITQSGISIEINNLKSNILIFTDYYDVLEVRVLTDSMSNNTIIVVSSRIKQSASKKSSKPDDK